MDAYPLEVETTLVGSSSDDPSWLCDGERRDWIEIYGKSRAKWSDKHLVLLRWLNCAFWILAFFGSVVASAAKGKARTIKFCFAQATYWVASLEVLYLAMSAIMTTLARRVPGDRTPRIAHWFAHAALFLNRAVTASVIPVCVMYWIMVAAKLMRVFHPESWTTHGVNLLPIILDVLISRQSLPLKMIWIPLLNILIYTAFGLIYCSMDDTRKDRRYMLYGFNWYAKPGKAAGLLSAFFFTTALSYVVTSWFVRPRAGRDVRSIESPDVPEFI